MIGLNKEKSFNASEIKNENGIKYKIEEIKYKNKIKNIKEYKICIHFRQSESKKIIFFSNFILNNFKSDNYNYIFIIHIKRNIKSNFTDKNYERIYYLADINNDINQLFIDNLNGNNNITLKYLLTNDIIDILKENYMELNEEFNKTLKITLNKSLNDYDTKEDYINKLQYYLEEEVSIKVKIFETVFNLIEKEKENCKDLVEKKYKEKYINILSIDIASLLIDYIKENTFK